MDPPPVAVSSLAVQGVALNTVLAGAGTLKGQKMLTNSGLANGWLLGVILWSVRAAPKFARPANATHTHRTTRRADARLARLDDVHRVPAGGLVRDEGEEGEEGGDGHRRGPRRQARPRERVGRRGDRGVLRARDAAVAGARHALKR